MTKLARLIGFLLLWSGALLLLFWFIWFIKPLRAIRDLFLQLPLLLQIGLAAAAVGFILLLGTVIWERIQSRKTDKELQDEP